MVQVLRVTSAGGGLPRVEPVVDVVAAEMPAGYSRTSAERLAVQALSGKADSRTVETLGSSGDLLHAAAVITAKDGKATGVVVATDYLTGDLAARSRRMTQAFEKLQPAQGPQAAADRRLSLVLPDGDAADPRRLDVDGAVPRPSGSRGPSRCSPPRRARLARAASTSASSLKATTSSGRWSRRSTRWPASWPTSRRKVDRATIELERKHSGGGRSAAVHRDDSRAHHDRRRLGRRRRRDHHDQQRGRAGSSVSAGPVVGQPAQTRSSSAPTSSRLPRCSPARDEAAASRPAQEIAMPRDGQELHLAVVATALVGESGAPEGAVLVLDDVTPLIRAQKVAAWREVARRLAHEIKNPLTPIQLCAERHAPSFRGRAAGSQGAGRRVHDHHRRRGRVAEGPGRRVLAVRAHAGAAHRADRSGAAHHRDDRALQRHPRPTCESSGVSPTRCRSFASTRSRSGASSSTSWTTRSRRWSAAARSSSRPSCDRANSVARVVVADDGPGIPPAEREKLFLPYYSTKRRGSGLGLAIVRRIIAEHGGSVEVTDNIPRGTRFTIELPC